MNPAENRQKSRYLSLFLMVWLGFAPTAVAQEDCAPDAPALERSLRDTIRNIVSLLAGEFLLGPRIASPFAENASLTRVAMHPSLADAPDTVEISSALRKGMRAAWDKSLPVVEGKQVGREHGGIYVQMEDGTHEWRPGVPGDQGSFSPNYLDLNEGENLVAVVHTHPYTDVESDGKQGGYNTALSGQDLAPLCV